MPYFPILYFLILTLTVRRRIIIQSGSISKGKKKSVFIGQNLFYQAQKLQFKAWYFEIMVGGWLLSFAEIACFSGKNP